MELDHQRNPGETYLENEMELNNQRNPAETYLENEMELNNQENPGETYFENEVELNNQENPGETYFENEVKLNNQRNPAETYLENEMELNNQRNSGETYLENEMEPRENNDGQQDCLLCNRIFATNLELLDHLYTHFNIYDTQFAKIYKDKSDIKILNNKHNGKVSQQKYGQLQNKKRIQVKQRQQFDSRTNLTIANKRKILSGDPIDTPKKSRRLENQQNFYNSTIYQIAYMKCPKCSMYFKRELLFSEHLMFNHRKTHFEAPEYYRVYYLDLKCRFCGREYDSRRQYNNHVLKAHTRQKCKRCSEIFKSSTFYTHIKVCEKGSNKLGDVSVNASHKLDMSKQYLAKGMNNEENLLKQNPTKYKESIKSPLVKQTLCYKCHECETYIKYKSNFQRHMKCIHKKHLSLDIPAMYCVTEPNFKCKCSKEFSTINQYCNHLKKSHSVCSFCNKKLSWYAIFAHESKCTKKLTNIELDHSSEASQVTKQGKHHQVVLYHKCRICARILKGDREKQLHSLKHASESTLLDGPMFVKQSLKLNIKNSNRKLSKNRPLKDTVIKKQLTKVKPKKCTTTYLSATVFKCDICRFIFFRGLNAKHHYKMCNTTNKCDLTKRLNKIECKICNVYINKCHYSVHKKQHNFFNKFQIITLSDYVKNPLKYLFKCNMCDVHFRAEMLFLNHLKICQQKKQLYDECTECDIKLAQNLICKSLDLHLQAHETYGSDFVIIEYYNYQRKQESSIATVNVHENQLDRQSVMGTSSSESDSDYKPSKKTKPRAKVNPYGAHHSGTFPKVSYVGQNNDADIEESPCSFQTNYGLNIAQANVQETVKETQNSNIDLEITSAQSLLNKTNIQTFSQEERDFVNDNDDGNLEDPSEKVRNVIILGSKPGTTKNTEGKFQKMLEKAKSMPCKPLIGPKCFKKALKEALKNTEEQCG